MRPDDVERFLAEPHVAVLATLRRGGLPYTVPIWHLWRDGLFWFTGTYERVWCRQLFADPRASLCIEAGPPFAGHVGADGTVTAHEPGSFDIWPITGALVDKYVRAPAGDVAADAFMANLRTEHRLLFSLRPAVLRAIDMRVYRGKRADREWQASAGPPAGRPAQ